MSSDIACHVPAPPVALVVDDECDLAWALEQALASDGWQVILAYTGGAAVEQAAASPIQMAFVDAKLPDMDGLDVAARIGRLQPSATVVLVSGYFYPEDSEVQEALRQGLFVQFIAKPFDLDEVLALARSTRRMRVAPAAPGQLVRPQSEAVVRKG